MKEGIDLVTKLMAISAQNAPKALDTSYLDINMLDEAEKEILVEEMYQLADERDDETYTEKGEVIEKSDTILLIGLNEHPGLGIDCKACGFETCKKMESAEKKEDIFEGPNCIFRLIDLGIALGYALQSSSSNNVDSKIMIKAGLAAKNLGLSTTKICLAIPTRVNSKMELFGL